MVWLNSINNSKLDIFAMILTSFKDSLAKFQISKIKSKIKKKKPRIQEHSVIQNEIKKYNKSKFKKFHKKSLHNKWPKRKSKLKNNLNWRTIYSAKMQTKMIINLNWKCILKRYCTQQKTEIKEKVETQTFGRIHNTKCKVSNKTN